MDKFIYVFNSADKESLLAHGYLLLKEDYNNNIFIFDANSSDKQFALSDVDSYVASDTLTF